MIKKLPIELLIDILKFLNLDNIHLFYSINKSYNSYLSINDFYIWSKLFMFNRINIYKYQNLIYIKLNFYNISFPSNIKLKKMYYRNIKKIIKDDFEKYKCLKV